MCIAENAAAVGMAKRRMGGVETPGDREDDGQHDDEAGVEKHREAEEQRCEPQRERGAGGPEAVNEGVGECLRTAGVFNKLAEHRPQPHQDAHVAEGGAEARHCDVVDRLQRDAGHDRGEQRDQHERDEGV